MEYTKPALTFEQQLDRLISRGLQVSDRSKALEVLEKISYYRLSAYFIPFQLEKDKFKNNITFEDICSLYEFDKKLRFLILEVLEIIEIAVRTELTYSLAHTLGPFGYLEQKHYFHYFKHAKWVKSIKEEIDRSKETFIQHYQSKYSKMQHLPIWMATETFSFGSLSMMYGGLLHQYSRPLAKKIGLHPLVLSSWLHSLCYIRNICAHHGRLWNKGLGIEPKIPNKSTLWKFYDHRAHKGLFPIILIINYLLKKLKIESDFKSRLGKLLASYPIANIKKMGFPEDWKNLDIWKI